MSFEAWVTVIILHLMLIPLQVTQKVSSSPAAYRSDGQWILIIKIGSLQMLSQTLSLLILTTMGHRKVLFLHHTDTQHFREVKELA